MAKMLTLEQVCVETNISRYTIETWYRFKREYPDDDLAQMLPEYYKEKEKSQRLWKKSDIKKLIKFKKEIKHTRNGNGNLTKSLQKYQKKKEK